jgi:hypothetical protein
VSGSSHSSSTIILFTKHSTSIVTLLQVEQGHVEGFLMQTRVPLNSYNESAQSRA